AGVQRACERQDAFDDGRTIREQKTAYERTIDLERVHRKLVQVAERRVAGTKIIEIDFHAEVAQPAQDLRDLHRILHQRRLGDLQPEVRWIQLGGVNRLLYERQKALLQKLPRRDVDRDAFELAVGKAALPFRKRLARLLQNPGAERLDQPELLGDGNEFRGRHGFAIALPLNQRFEAHAHSRRAHARG